MIDLDRGGKLARLFGTAIVMQAVLSAASLVVGLILIRRTSAVQYGYYVLISNAVLLLNAMQNAFIQPQMVMRLAGLEQQSDRENLIGGLYRDQRRLWPVLAATAVVGAIALRLVGLLSSPLLLIVLAATAAIVAAMYREFFRMVLLGYRLPGTVLRADAVYAVLLVLGSALATLSSAPAATAALTFSMAAGVGGTLTLRSLRRHEPWNIHGAPGILRQLAPLGTWSAAGAAIHWSYSQGYNYLVAGTLDISAVAAIAATRLLMMPINLMSTGISTVVYPMAATWLRHHGAAVVLRRLVLFATGLAVVAVCYFACLWVLRDWIFHSVFKKDFAGRDSLLILWGLVTLVILYRDQLGYLLAARARFRVYSSMTFASAVISLATSYFAMRSLGITGALVGVMTGELLNVAGICIFSIREARAQNC